MFAQKLGITLPEILADPETLFPFMQFMKSEAAVNVLQFYLTVGTWLACDVRGGRQRATVLPHCRYVARL